MVALVKAGSNDLGLSQSSARADSRGCRCMPALLMAGSIDQSLRQCIARADSRGCLRISRSTRRGKPSFGSESAWAEMMMPVHGCARQGRVKRPGLEPVQCPRGFAKMPVHACSLQGRVNRPELEAVQCPRGLERMAQCPTDMSTKS